MIRNWKEKRSEMKVSLAELKKKKKKPTVSDETVRKTTPTIIEQ